MRTPPQFAVGARVADPLEGRTGQISAFDAATGTYTLAFHDGHQLEVDEAGAARFVIPTATPSADASAAESAEDPQLLLGAVVSKVVTAYDGATAIVPGHVFSYIPTLKKYHVAFDDETREEWTREQVQQNVETTRVASKKRAAEEVDKDSPAKKHRKHRKHGSADESDNEDERPVVRRDDDDDNDDDDNDDDGPQLNQTKYPSRATAYAVIRKVLCVILAQSTIKKTRTEKQVTVLNNDDLKPKRALENFVEAGGLVCLQKVLVIWMRKPATHAGALLILKVLAALPGVTPDAVLQSNIGKTLRGIVSVCQTMGHVDRVLGDLAEWIIRSWKRSVLRQPMSLSARELIKENSSQLRAVDTLPLYIPPPPTSEKAMSAKQAMTNHLRRLLSGEADDECARRKAQEAAVEQESVVFLPQFNSLGSEDARRPQRQVVLLDTLAAKINREHVEGLRKQQLANERRSKEAQQQGQSDGGGGGGVTGAAAEAAAGGASTRSDNEGVWDEGRDTVDIGRLVFRRPQIQLFHRDAFVMNLRATARSRLYARQSVSATEDGLVLDEEVPASKLPPANKTAAPTKSILKVRDTTFIPAAQVQWRVEDKRA